MEKNITIIPGELGFTNRILVPQYPDNPNIDFLIYKAINNKDEIYFSFFFIKNKLSSYIAYFKKREIDGKLYFKLKVSRPFTSIDVNIIKEYFIQYGWENIIEIKDLVSLTNGFKTPSLIDKLYHSIIDNNYLYFLAK